MFASSTFDNLITVVVVILMLSLIVQSIQMGFKKILSLKSRQLEESLIDLFEHVLAGASACKRSGLAWLFGGVCAKAGGDVDTLYKDVHDQFKKLG